MTRDEFVEEFQTASQALWCIAAAVLGRADQAEDVLQEAAVIGLEKVSEFDPHTSFRAWMAQIVRNVARNVRRRNQRRQSVALDPDTLPHRRPRPASSSVNGVSSGGQLSPDQEAFDDRVLAALQSLQEAPRACLLLRVVHELSYREIAQCLDIPEGTAMSHVHRARRALHGRLAGSAAPRADADRTDTDTAADSLAATDSDS